MGMTDQIRASPSKSEHVFLPWTLARNPDTAFPILYIMYILSTLSPEKSRSKLSTQIKAFVDSFRRKPPFHTSHRSHPSHNENRWLELD